MYKQHWLSYLFSFSFISGVSGTSLFNSVSLMAYNVFYTSIPVLVSVLDKDLSEETVMQHPQILFYCQAGRFEFQNLSFFLFLDFYVGNFCEVCWHIKSLISQLMVVIHFICCLKQDFKSQHICWMVWSISISCKWLYLHITEHYFVFGKQCKRSRRLCIH